MKEFPKHLSVKYKERFPELNFNRMKCYLRKSLYEHIIASEEKDYFSLDDFCAKFHTPVETVKKMVSEVIPELENIGWTCKLSFGGTGLFIYSGEKPTNCWEEN